MYTSIAITGAAGFIGQHLMRYLQATVPATLLGLDNHKRGQWGDLSARASPTLRLVDGDIREATTVAQAFAGCDLVFHLAAQSNVLGAVADLEYSFTTNVVGTFNVLQAARAAGVRCVVFTSSREVYGEVTELPVPETAPLRAKNAYGASKLAGEAYARVFDSAEMRVVIVRLANVYGRGDRDRVIPIFQERLAQGQPLQLYDKDKILDFIPVEFVVAALWRAAQVQPTEPINIGSGQATTLEALAQRMVALSNTSGQIQALPSRSTAEVARFVAQVDRMKTVLGLTPPAPLENLSTLFPPPP